MLGCPTTTIKAATTPTRRAMSDSNPETMKTSDRLIRFGAVTAALGLGLLAYRALLDFDPTAADRHLRGGDAAFFSPSGNHPVFVYAIAVLIGLQRHRQFLGALGSGTSWGAGLLFFAGAIGLCAWSTFVDAPDLLVASLSLACLGVASTVAGSEGLRLAALPALVLLALIPIPPALLDELVYDLQIMTSTLSVWILQTVGVEAVQVADRFAAGDRIFQVIESCSGIRSTQTLTLTAVLLQEIFYRSRIQSLVLVGMAPLVGFAINEVRVLTLVANPYSDFAAVHAAQGLTMLVVGIVVLSGLDVALSRWLPAEPERPIGEPKRIAGSRLATLVAATGVLVLASGVERSAHVEQELEWNPVDIPLRLGDRRSKALQVDREYLGSTTFTQDANRRFRTADDFVDVFVGVNERGRRSAAHLSPKIPTLGTGRIAGPSESLALGAGLPEAEVMTVRTLQGRERVVLWRAHALSRGMEVLRELLALDRGPGRREGMPHVIRLSTPIADSSNLSSDDSKLREVALDLLAAIDVLEARTLENRRRRAARPSASGGSAAIPDPR